MADDKRGGGIGSGLVRALGTMLGVHMQYAQQEARGDFGRVLTGVLLLSLAAMLLLLALVLGHAAAVLLIQQRSSLDLLRSLAVVAGADVGVALLLVFLGRKRLQKPILKGTRSLVRRTAESLVEL